MAVSLTKGGNVSLSKTAPELKRIIVGLGWDARATEGFPFDLDASAFLLADNGKVRRDEDFIFYGTECRTRDGSTTFPDPGPSGDDDDDIPCGQKKRGCPCHSSLSVIHTGDNKTGAGDGDDEAIKIDLAKVPSAVQRIAITVTIHDAEARRQNFGQVSDAFMRIVNLDNDIEIVRFDLAEDYSAETAMIFGEIYRYNNEWKFKAVGQGFSGGLEAMCNQFGIAVA